MRPRIGHVQRALINQLELIGPIKRWDLTYSDRRSADSLVRQGKAEWRRLGSHVDALELHIVR